MKKFLSLVFGLIMCLGCGIALAACGKVTLKSITIDSGLNRSVLVGEELDTSNVVATVKWSDGKTATITSADLEFGEIDTTTPGTKDLTITYTKEAYTFVVKIKVGATDAEVESIIRMESKLLTQYNANVGVSQAEKTGFKDDEDKTAKRIYVGDDNAFNFRIAATGVPNRNPLASGPTITSASFAYSIICLTTKFKASPLANKGEISLKCTPGVGKSGTSSINFFKSFNCLNIYTSFIHIIKYFLAFLSIILLVC